MPFAGDTNKQISAPITLGVASALALVGFQIQTPNLSHEMPIPSH